MREPNRDFLRHTLATIAYRAAKAERDAPAGFGDFQIGHGARTPLQILAHMGDLFDWALSLVHGKWEYEQSAALQWRKEVARFHASLEALDAYLASDAPLGISTEKLFQGPIADALTHVGQIAMLRRQADAPVRAESYARSDIVAGRLGTEQPKSPFEFD
ncbi:MAG: hypothetical protein M3P26_16800 [Gemmatimonadota bacterium]|nr:hypothetical protein [Gemmatimonadota bacterium]